MKELNEVWKDIEGYEGLYQVSNLGRVKSLKKNIIRKQTLGKDGYLRVILKHNGKSKNFSVHRLVAKAFLKNVFNYPEVNHKDENKTNNNVSNLEWCTRKYNQNYNGLPMRIASKIDYKNRKPIDFSQPIFKINAKKRQEKFSKKVNQYNMNGELIKTWNSTKECGRNGFNQSCVWHCCKGIYKQYKGYIWKYANEVKTNGN